MALMFQNGLSNRVPPSPIQSRIVLPNQALQYFAFGNCCKAYLFLG